MATKDMQETKALNSQEEKFSIEKLKKRHNIKESVFAGVKAYKKWAEGKMTTDAEFIKAVEEFLGAPIDKAVKR